MSMGLPNINIQFIEAGIMAIQRAKKGTVLILLRGTGATATTQELLTSTDIPAAWTDANKAYVERAFVGYQSAPRKLLVRVGATDEDDMTEGLQWAGTQQFDYLVGPPDLSATEATAIATWIQTQRTAYATYKAVLPDKPADNPGIVNFTADGIKVGADSFTTAQYCSRIAGLIAGTPMVISCTYAPLPEVTDCERLTKTQLDSRIAAGELLLYHDGEKAKLARGVNSYVTTVQGKGKSYQKIKLVETMDMIRHDIRKTAEDSYIGKYANSYDNKILLCTAILGYFQQLEAEGILEPGTSRVYVDWEANGVHLRSKGIDTSEYSTQLLKEANTDDKVYLGAQLTLLDAIEDIDLKVNI